MHETALNLPRLAKFENRPVNILAQPVIIGANNHFVSNPSCLGSELQAVRSTWFLGIIVAFVKRTMSPFDVPISCLFVINGLGLGNSTRCHAVIEHLAAAGCRVHVLTSGNGLAYFEGRSGIDRSTRWSPSIIPAPTAASAAGPRLNPSAPSPDWPGPSANPSAQLLDNVNPDVAVIDSEYAISPLRRRRIPIVAINNSEVVVTEFLKRRRQANGARSHFWFVEFSDYLFHRRYCDLVLSPVPAAHADAPSQIPPHRADRPPRRPGTRRRAAHQCFRRTSSATSSSC